MDATFFTALGVLPSPVRSAVGFGGKPIAWKAPIAFFDAKERFRIDIILVFRNPIGHARRLELKPKMIELHIR